MKCPICAEEIRLERNLPKHQRGKVCQAIEFERLRAAEGWRPFGLQYKFENILQEAGVDFVLGPRVYIGGFQQRVIHIRKALWVPPHVADILDRRVGIWTFLGPKRMLSILELRKKLRNLSFVPAPR